MKSIVLVLVIGIVLTSCEITYNADQLNNLKKPLVVTAKSKNRGENECLVVCDGDNVHHVLPTNGYVNKALYDTYNVGDTIK